MLVPADVIEHRLDDVRVNAELAHAGGGGAAQIVIAPVLHLSAKGFDARVEQNLG